MLENYDLLVDKKILNLADFKEKDVFAILALLLRNQQVMSVARVVEEEDNVFVASPGDLYGNFFDVTGVSRKARTSFVNSIKRIAENDLIVIKEVNGKKNDGTRRIQWNSLLKIDCNNLLHVSRKPYIIVGTEEINGIIYQDKMDFETLLQVYINIVSYINQKDVSDADLGKIDLSYEIYGKMDIHLSCFASINTLCTKRFSGDKNEEVWISNKTIIKAIKILEEIGAIAIVVPKKPKGCKQNFSNHYCYPRHKEMVQRIADNYVKQVLS